MNYRFSVSAALCSAVLSAAASSVSADVTVGGWTPLFQGIDHAIGSTTIDANNPRQHAVNALRIDLQNPTISFFTTPQSGTNETTTQTTRSFLEQHNLAVAVNANFWDVIVNPYVQEQVNLQGLAVSNGTVVSPAQSGFGSSILTLTSGNVAAISTSTAGMSTAGIQNAVAGNQFVVVDGVNPLTPGAGTAAPRTAAGISQDGRYLILLTIDGRNPGHSDGAIEFETGEWMLRFGAYDAINLDGGGSTTMVRDDGAGNGVVMNVPAGGFPIPVGLERLVGNNLGVFALPIPESASLAVLGLGAVVLMRRRTGR
jgi:exopolysaccharide biosynthesis protein